MVCNAKFLFKMKPFLRLQTLSLGSFTVFSFLLNGADTASVVTFSPKTRAFSSTNNSPSQNTTETAQTAFRGAASNFHPTATGSVVMLSPRTWEF